MAQELGVKGISPTDAQAVTYVPQKPPTPPPTTQQPVKEAARQPEKAQGDDQVNKMLEQAVQKQDSQKVVLDYDKDIGQSIVKVIDKTSGDVVRQFPPEEIVRMAEMMDQTSLLLNKKI